ncbi:MAG: hypothetical protein JXR91_08400 [Deltaproteobacteria bacterium]|nr:hypothetical protein [Deltaproteobacteria bacterium]
MVAAKHFTLSPILKFTSFFILLTVSNLLFAQENTTSDEIDTTIENPVCQPGCRGNFVCIDGKCKTPCGSLCAKNEICIDAKCVSKPIQIESIPDQAQVQEKSSDEESSDYEDYILWTISEEREENTYREQKDMRKFALLLNPAALIPIYGIIGIPLNLQIGKRYLALDIILTGILGDIIGFTGEAGLRILPMGRGLKGFYIVPRVGGGYPVGFMATCEVGYSFMPGNFALNLGAGAGYASEYGFLPFGNVSIGFGF